MMPLTETDILLFFVCLFFYLNCAFKGLHVVVSTTQTSRLHFIQCAPYAPYFVSSRYILMPENTSNLKAFSIIILL